MFHHEDPDEELERVQQEGNPWAQANAYTRAGQELLERKEYSRAASLFQKAAGVFGRMGERLAQARALNQLGACLVLTGQAQAALEPLEEALSCLEGSREPALEAAVEGNLGLAFSSMSDYRSAFKAHKAVLESAEGIGDDRLRLNALINLADCSYQDHNYRSAQGFALVALDLAKTLAHAPGIITIYDQLGMISARMGDLKAALEYHERAYLEAKQQGDLLRQGISLANQGLAWEGLTELDRAAEVMGQAEVIFKEIKSDLLQKTQRDLKRIRAGRAS